VEISGKMLDGTEEYFFAFCVLGDFGNVMVLSHLSI
jgi:hypothetical protein